MTMNKGQGLFAGAILALAILLRPLGMNTPTVNDTVRVSQAQPGSPSDGTETTSPNVEGPWIASCRYWAPVTSDTQGSSAVTKQSDVSGTGIQDVPCGVSDKNRWGLPEKAENGSDSSPNITALIATVPDPVHTHLALAFDRSMQVLLQAAFDSGYVSSNYWLPWKSDHGISRYIESPGGNEPGHNPEREREPGLMILKRVPVGDDPLTPEVSYYKAIYIFLVSETPTRGVDGFQLRKALQYESSLKSWVIPGGSFSSGPRDQTAIIGPIYSGSAASLRAGIDAFCQNHADTSCGNRSFLVVGSTRTTLSARQLTDTVKAENPCEVDTSTKQPGKIAYLSFGPHISYNMGEFFRMAKASGTDLTKIAVLSEDSTAYGNKGLNGLDISPLPCDSAYEKNRLNTADSILYMYFPREISLLRNTPVDSDSSGNSTSGTVPSPYLHFSVRDSSGQDSMVQFSREHSPLSQEAQLMEIARELNRRRTELIAISASDELDLIFLAQFFRRASPNARLAFVDSDLLMARDVDNLPYVGSITVSPYLFMTKLRRLPGESSRVYTDTTSAAFYNASRFVFVDIDIPRDPTKINQYLSKLKVPFQGYRLPISGNGYRAPLLWATTLGTDGYYPLGVITPCSSDPDFSKYYEGITPNTATQHLLPDIDITLDDPAKLMNHYCDLKDANQRLTNPANSSTANPSTIYPSLNWVALCVVVGLLCVIHVLLLWTADYYSPLTHDLAVYGNDQPRRRSMYINISTAVLFSMACVLAIPLLVLAMSRIVEVGGFSFCLAWLVMVCGAVAIAAAFRVTRKQIGWTRDKGSVTWKNWRSPKYAFTRLKTNVYFFLNLLSLMAAIGIPLWWLYICMNNQHNVPISATNPSGQSIAIYDMVGLAFAFRCVYPESGVSPVVPVLLLLLGWYFWGVLQTWRMRFPRELGPWLPGESQNAADNALFVAENDLVGSEKPMPGEAALYQNITCLFLIRRLVHKILRSRSAAVDIALAVLYAGVFSLFLLHNFFRSVDHLFWRVPYPLSSPYEAIVSALIFPLFWCSFSAWLRLIFIWKSLKGGLLDPLETQPIRFAFNRLQGKGWINVISRVGWQEQRRDLDRCIESMRQMLHLDDLKRSLTLKQRLNFSIDSDQILDIRERIRKDDEGNGERGNELTKDLRGKLADFSRDILSSILIPFWKNERTGLVESEDAEVMPIKAKRSDQHSDPPRIPMELQAGPASENPSRILAAEEFLAMRYMTLIRAVVGNMIYLIIFVAVIFVLTVISWNSYPFQPRQIVDWLFTANLVIFGFGVVFVFAQMHRDPILSRATATKPNELGWDFYLRIISFGAVPVFTWLAYQFPDIGSSIYKFIQPSTSVFR
jgi:hypothetical protein